MVEKFNLPIGKIVIIMEQSNTIIYYGKTGISQGFQIPRSILWSEQNRVEPSHGSVFYHNF